jgi:ATP-dependent Clp protease ATP-binding subunit ClpA
MAFSFTLPFYAFRLRFPAPDLAVLKPLSENSVVRVGQSFEKLAERYRELFQSKVLNKGDAGYLLDFSIYGAFERDTITVSFPKAKDGVAFPAFQLELDFFFTQKRGKWWAVAPVTGIEAAADTEEMLRKILADNVKIFFAQTHRLKAAQGLVSTIWYESVELLQKEIQLEALTPAEVDALEEDKKRQLIGEASTLLFVSRQEAYGMEAELEQISRALRNNFGRNLLLVGPGGVGKSALVLEAVRQWQQAGNPGKVWETTASLLIKELTRDTGWQYNLAFLCRELSASGDWLYVRNLMELFEVGRYAGNEVSMGEYLRGYLSRGEISIISECTEEELHLIDEKSPNYSTFFQVVRILPPNDAALEAIIQSKVASLADEKKLRFGPGAVQEAIRLYKRFNPYSGMPGKVIRFLEAVIRMPLDAQTAKTRTLTKAQIVKGFCEETGIPAVMIDDAIPLHPEQIKEDFNRNVFGQPNAVERTVDILAREKTRLSRSGKPIASLLFVGPTGVGKTELAKVLAGFVFGDRNRMIRFDMSEFSGPDASVKLSGIGQADGLLTAAVRREPFCVLLFDEIEKADSSFFDILLQILDAGRLTDGSGKLVNFCSAIIIMTSNIGATGSRFKPIAMRPNNSPDDFTEHYKRAVEKFFRPELVNRMDEIIPFHALDAASIRKVVERELALLKNREGIRYRRMSFQLEDEVLDYLGEKGFNPDYGARYLQRAAREQLVMPLARRLSAEDADDHLNVQVRMSDGEAQIDMESDPLSLELLLEELQIANHANLAGTLRRQAVLLEDSFCFREIRSDLEMLEDARKRDGAAFWKDHTKATAFATLQKLVETQQTLSTEIEDIERNACLGFIGAALHAADLPHQLKRWNEHHDAFKKKLVQHKMPEHNQCVLGIYGRELLPVIQFYLELFNRRNFKLRTQSVWVNEAFYNEEIIVPAAAEGGSPQRKKREEYLKAAAGNAYAPELDRHPKGEQLVGVEFTISGDMAHLFLSAENGYQSWEDDIKNWRKYFVAVNLPDRFSTPARVHRMDFFKPNPRRTVGREVQKDVPYGIDMEGSYQDFFKNVLAAMETNFNTAIDDALLG